MKKNVFIVLIALLLVSCASSDGDPAQTVEMYLQAKANSDESTIRQLLCTEMESVAEREVHTFESVSGVRIEDMACERVNDSQVVTCEGSILATYGTEDTEFPLVSYKVVEEDGEWKWCGEAAP